jgi:hypothetical protein
VQNQVLVLPTLAQVVLVLPLPVLEVLPAHAVVLVRQPSPFRMAPFRCQYLRHEEEVGCRLACRRLYRQSRRARDMGTCPTCRACQIISRIHNRRRLFMGALDTTTLQVDMATIDTGDLAWWQYGASRIIWGISRLRYRP